MGFLCILPPCQLAAAAETNAIRFSFNFEAETYYGKLQDGDLEVVRGKGGVLSSYYNMRAPSELQRLAEVLVAAVPPISMRGGVSREALAKDSFFFIGNGSRAGLLRETRGLSDAAQFCAAVRDLVARDAGEPVDGCYLLSFPAAGSESEETLVPPPADRGVYAVLQSAMNHPAFPMKVGPELVPKLPKYESYMADLDGRLYLLSSLPAGSFSLTQWFSEP